MPFKTKYGKHYHMTEGCHGATIPCDTGGLTPCSDCCGKAETKASAGSAGAGSPKGAGSSIPAGTTVIHSPGRADVTVDGTVIETRKVGASISPMADGVLYRFDSKLPDDQQRALDALPGIQVMPDEWSLDMTERTTAMIVYDVGPDYGIDYAQTITDLGVRALGQGFAIDSDSVDTAGVAAWLARNKESEWDTATLPYRIDPAGEPRHVDNGYGDTYTVYPLVELPDGHPCAEYLPMPYRKPEGVAFTYTKGDWRGNHRKVNGIIVYDGYEAVAREVDGQTKIGVRKHYDEPVMRDAAAADWQVVESGKGGDTLEAKGVAYRTPAGDARMTMTISPDPSRKGHVRVGITVDDPYLGEPIEVAVSEGATSVEEAKSEVCQAHLDRATLGARMGPGAIRQAYQRNLASIARRHFEEQGMEVERVRRTSPTEVEVECLEGGYVPVRRVLKLTRDGKVESYAR